MNSTEQSFANRCAALLAERPELFAEASPSPQMVQTGWWWASPHTEAWEKPLQGRRQRRSRQLRLEIAA